MVIFKLEGGRKIKDEGWCDSYQNEYNICVMLNGKLASKTLIILLFPSPYETPTL